MPVEEYEHDGVWVTHARAAGDRPPLVFVHGGAHASWCWEHYPDLRIIPRWFRLWLVGGGVRAGLVGIVLAA